MGIKNPPSLQIFQLHNQTQKAEYNKWRDFWKSEMRMCYLYEIRVKMTRLRVDFKYNFAKTTSTSLIYAHK
jgi:hypothetical protein